MCCASSISFMIDGASTKGMAGRVFTKRWCCIARLKWPPWPSSCASVNTLRMVFDQVIRMYGCTP
jgi:hypothetical protein